MIHHTSERAATSSRSQRMAMLVAVVVLAALLLFKGGQCGSETREVSAWSHLGLSLQLPEHFAPIAVTQRFPAFDIAGQSRRVGAGDLHREHFGPSEVLGSRLRDRLRIRIEIAVRSKPGFGNVGAALALMRRLKYGPSYRALDTEIVVLADRPWWQTRFEYTSERQGASGALKNLALEYTAVQHERLYMIGLHGEHDVVERYAASVTASARLQDAVVDQPPWNAVHGSRLAPAAIAKLPDGVVESMVATVVIAVGDIRDQQIDVVGGGSGTIVSPDGAILTNLHVIRDEDRDRLHDVFFIGRFRGLGQVPVFSCVGRPGDSRVDKTVDLALLRCERDVEGLPWLPTDWPWIAPRNADAGTLGPHIYVVGFPDSGSGYSVLSQGKISGWTSDSDHTGYGYWRTNADISAGFSGGTVLDSQGYFIGVPSAYRLRARIRQNSLDTTIERVGLIRSVSDATALIALSRTGWVRAGDSQ